MSRPEEPEMIRIRREMLAAADLLKHARLSFQAAKDRLANEEASFQKLERTFISLQAEQDFLIDYDCYMATVR